jgi:hypothetical protein
MHNDLKHCNFRKDDAIAHLSDQLLTISTRLQELERKQQITMLILLVNSVLSVRTSSLSTVLKFIS